MFISLSVPRFQGHRAESYTVQNVCMVEIIVILHYYYCDEFKQGDITHSFCKSLSLDEQFTVNV